MPTTTDGFHGNTDTKHKFNLQVGPKTGVPHLDVVQDELVSMLGGGHLAVGDGLPQCLLGNEGVQVQDGGQTAVQTDELLLVGAEMD